MKELRACLQLRNEIVPLIAEDMIEELRRWGDLLRVVDKAIDVGHEYLQKDCKVEDQSSKENTHTDSRQSLNLKLSRIEVPKFNGDELKSQNFWDQFEAAVHNNDDLPSCRSLLTYAQCVLVMLCKQ